MASRHANLPRPALRLFRRAQLRRLGRSGFHLRRAPGRAGGKARDQPGAEQRDRLIAEVLGMGGQIVAVALIEPEVERTREDLSNEADRKSTRLNSTHT